MGETLELRIWFCEKQFAKLGQKNELSTWGAFEIDTWICGKYLPIVRTHLLTYHVSQVCGVAEQNSGFSISIMDS